MKLGEEMPEKLREAIRLEISADDTLYSGALKTLMNEKSFTIDEAVAELRKNIIDSTTEEEKAEHFKALREATEFVKLQQKRN